MTPLWRTPSSDNALSYSWCTSHRDVIFVYIVTRKPENRNLVLHLKFYIEDILLKNIQLAIKKNEEENANLIGYQIIFEKTFSLPVVSNISVKSNK